jgi:hypothetical protein
MGDAQLRIEYELELSTFFWTVEVEDDLFLANADEFRRHFINNRNGKRHRDHGSLPTRLDGFSMERLEATRPYSAVARMVGFGFGRSKILYLSRGID